MKMPRLWRKMQLRERANLPRARTSIIQRDFKAIVICKDVALIQTKPR